MHWLPENVNPMLALRMSLCNGRWQESWGDQQRWNHQARTQQRRHRQQRRLSQKQQKQRALRTRVAPAPLPAPVRVPPSTSPKPSSGRTEAQRRWGRQTFSSRLLHQGGDTDS